MTGAESFKYFALMSSIPVALLTLRFCNCCCINEKKPVELKILYHQVLYHLQSLAT